jgi:hypothetical protein
MTSAAILRLVVNRRKKFFTYSEDAWSGNLSSRVLRGFKQWRSFGGALSGSVEGCPALVGE